MGKSTISMAIFNSKQLVYQRVTRMSKESTHKPGLLVAVTWLMRWPGHSQNLVREFLQETPQKKGPTTRFCFRSFKILLKETVFFTMSFPTISTLNHHFCSVKTSINPLVTWRNPHKVASPWTKNCCIGPAVTSPRGCTWAPGLQLGRAWVAAGLPDTILWW